MPRDIRTGLLGLITAALLCGPALGQQSKPWRHAIIEPKSDAGFVLMVKHGGFAQKQGLNLETLNVKADSIALKALLAGELESYEGGPGGVVIAAARGADLKIIGCQWPGLVHGIFVRGDIKSAQDLKGKNIAISTPGALPDLLIRAVLEKNKIADTEVKFANLGGDTDRYKALLAGVVDAAIVSSEYLPAAPAGIKMLIAGREIMPNFMRVCLVTTGKVLAERGDDAVRFLAAQMQALRHAVKNRDETLKLTFEVTGAKPDDPRPAFIYDEILRHKDIDTELKIPLDKIDWMQGQLVSAGLLKKPIDVSKVTDDSVRARASARAGQ
jgi:NitT/TauT family transport system substrate-binding protein